MVVLEVETSELQGAEKIKHLGKIIDLETHLLCVIVVSESTNTSKDVVTLITLRNIYTYKHLANNTSSFILSISHCISLEQALSMYCIITDFTD